MEILRKLADSHFWLAEESSRIPCLTQDYTIIDMVAGGFFFTVQEGQAIHKHSFLLI
jgi:hypothetical protein